MDCDDFSGIVDANGGRVVNKMPRADAARIVCAVNRDSRAYAAMKEALEPFAKLASHYPEHVADYGYVQIGTNNRFITVGDLRRASAALAQAEEKQ
jgi:hypothetical protein